MPHIPRSAAVGAVVTTALAAGLLAVSSPAASADEVRVHDIQGTTRLSPLAGQQVTDVRGIVTGVRGYDLDPSGRRRHQRPSGSSRQRRWPAPSGGPESPNVRPARREVRALPVRARR